MIAINDRPAIAEAELEPNPVIEASSPEGTETSPGVGLVPGSTPSLSDPADVLLLGRLRWFAFLLTIIYGAVLIWVLSSRDDLHQPLVVLLGLRVTVAMVLLGLLFGPMAETPSHLRWSELALFGGLTVCLTLSQYLIGRDLIGAGDLPGVLAHEKDGLIERVILMIAYAMLIPNDARRAAIVVLTMALAPFLATGILLTGHETPAPILAELRIVEPIGQDVLTVLIGAALAVYGASSLNRLRSGARRAPRFG
jgi:hypothetical protein